MKTKKFTELSFYDKDCNYIKSILLDRISKNNLSNKIEFYFTQFKNAKFIHVTIWV